MQNDHPEPQPQEPIDPHSSKIPADDPRLQLPKKKSRTLKKGPVIAISATLTSVIAAALVLALQPQHKSTEKENKDRETEAVAQPTIPDVVRKAPDERSPVSIPDTSITASVPDDVPQLGRPLPGDLGHAMVHSPNGYRTGAGQSAPPDPAEQERLAAIASSPFFGGASASITTPASGGIAGLQAAASPVPGSAPYGRDQNNQARKNDFFESGGGDGKEYLSKPVRKPVSRYEVKAGAIIPAILVTGLNSDLPGNGRPSCGTSSGTEAVIEVSGMLTGERSSGACLTTSGMVGWATASVSPVLPSCSVLLCCGCSASTSAAAIIPVSVAEIATTGPFLRVRLFFLGSWRRGSSAGIFELCGSLSSCGCGSGLSVCMVLTPLGYFFLIRTTTFPFSPARSSASLKRRSTM